MIAILIVALASVTTDLAHGKYQHVSHGLISQHKVATTWDNAYEKCQREGAVLASPTTEELRDKMQSLIGDDTMYFTGTRATYDDVYVSIEGELLDDMPVLHLTARLDAEKGRCLTMNSSNITVAPCSDRLPYLCFKSQKENTTFNSCDTSDKDYKYISSTGSCYKLHTTDVNWVVASSTCNSEGGYLAIVNDAYEAKMIVKELFSLQSRYIWIGLTKNTEAEGWKSVKGHSINELHHVWDNSPEWTHYHATVRCASINPINGKIKDLGNCVSGIAIPFLCEKDAPKREETLEAYNNTSVKNRA